MTAMRRLLLGGACGLLSLSLATPASTADRGPAGNRSTARLTLAVIGDTPYGVAQLPLFPGLVENINRDPKVRRVLHLGDIKNGSSRCSDEYFATIASMTSRFRDPVVYTPGDNEWTDCHRVNNGRYHPLERLDAIRDTFFPRPGLTLGQHRRPVDTQGDDPAHAEFVENVRWSESRVTFATVHVVGGNNGLLAWSGLPETPQLRDQRLAEVAARTAAALDWIDGAFDTAAADDALGVLLAMQADMWDGATLDGFDAVVARIAERGLAFGRPVLLLEGDSARLSRRPSARRRRRAPRRRGGGAQPDPAGGGGRDGLGVAAPHRRPPEPGAVQLGADLPVSPVRPARPGAGRGCPAPPGTRPIGRACRPGRARRRPGS